MPRQTYDVTNKLKNTSRYFLREFAEEILTNSLFILIK